MRKLPVKLTDRYAALENYRKLGELNEFRRRKLAMRELLNHRLELERHRGYIDSQRMYALRHVMSSLTISRMTRPSSSSPTAWPSGRATTPF